MPIVKLIDLFKFSPDGIRVLEYPPGEHDLDGRALEVAKSMGIIDDSAAREAAEQAAREQAEREAAEQAAREQAEREVAEKSGQGAAAEGAAAAAPEGSAKPEKRAPKGAAKSD
ncbi:hypothetical protein [Pseudomonas nitroreducens]|uniref:Uncharacterized protein n=1 Tax=Pseudomonas nitroreducens TaxID=46680 RepID=A0A2D0ADV7_PSENT|nr:hypothetical protein [Pseudomonas nitroreducens]OWP50264.1 hypothetical protein CEG18_11970 [Pseudomonas nitroreducens]